MMKILGIQYDVIVHCSVCMNKYIVPANKVLMVDLGEGVTLYGYMCGWCQLNGGACFECCDFEDMELELRMLVLFVYDRAIKEDRKLIKGHIRNMKVDLRSMRPSVYRSTREYESVKAVNEALDDVIKII